MNALVRLAVGVMVPVAAFGAVPAGNPEARIRAVLAARFPDLPKIDEVTKTAFPGVYEVRSGNVLLYSDVTGDHVLQGSMIETRTRRDLTRARLDKLDTIDFDRLPLKDAIVWKQGNGSRKLVVFADPNCVYCKKFETEAQQIKDVTVYTFLIPILGGDSPQKARDVWCAKDNGAVWRDWMIRGVRAPPGAADCDSSALQRNVALSRSQRVAGTPLIVFENGTRVAGAMPSQAVEEALAKVSAHN